MSPVSTRLIRLLNMVPYFQANPRITYAEAAVDLGVSVKQLREDLNQLWMCGLPGYGPGDLIDFEFSGDTIEVTFSAGIDRPLKLTSPEATGLLVALRALADSRVVDPIRVLLIGGHSYLEAWSRESEGVRLFRFDRIVDAAELGEPAAPPG